MKYVVKEPPRDGLVADADALMREFNRAIAVVHDDVDQNNLSNNTLKWKKIAHPVDQWESSTSIVGKATATPTGLIATPHFTNQVSDYTLDAPAASEDGNYEERAESKFWQYVETTSGVKLSLDSLSLNEAAEMTIMVNGQIRIAAEATINDGLFRTSIYDIRILDGGSPLDAFVTVSSETNHGYLPFHISARPLLVAGDHTIRIQVRDRSDGEAASVISDTVICAYGFVR
jgi:hypothetical protein